MAKNGRFSLSKMAWAAVAGYLFGALWSLGPRFALSRGWTPEWMFHSPVPGFVFKGTREIAVTLLTPFGMLQNIPPILVGILVYALLSRRAARFES